MKIKLLVVGKTDAKALKELIQKYESRLRYYITFSIEIIPDLKHSKNLSISQQKEKEGQLILNNISATDRLFLLDEKGKDYDSIEFSKFLQKQMNSGLKQMVAWALSIAHSTSSLGCLVEAHNSRTIFSLANLGAIGPMCGPIQA